MVLLLIGIIIGIIVVTILIVKITKTNPHEVLGYDMHCKTCGLEIKGYRCPHCEKNHESFGV